MALPRGKAGSCFGLSACSLGLGPLRPLGQEKEGEEEEPRRPAREWAPGTGYGYLTHGTGQENATLASFAFSQVRQYSTTITPEKINIPSYETVLQLINEPVREGLFLARNTSQAAGCFLQVM